ncbi:MAG TPA: DUF29 domain-containing protein [Azospirillum sp.]|nr:DUF29 domain-containing protein [Azospirillum sp.]
MGYSAKYDEDFYAWTMEQATRLREAGASGANLPLDWENLAEEIESMGRNDRRGVTSHLATVIEHLLKLEHSPAAEPRRGWMLSVRNARREAEKLLRESPSLKAKLPDILADAWKDGREDASDGLVTDSVPAADLPKDCPYTLEQVRAPDWWPENRHGLT